jgi:2-methylisocitrate lyase-like PEP mutase family enzyme
MEEALARCRGAITEADVDGIFFEAIKSRDEARQVIAMVHDLEKEVGRDIPVLLNVVAGGDTPELSVAEAQEIGFRVVIFPMACMDAVIDECGKRLAKLKETGESWGGPGVKRAFNLCGLQECMEIDRAAGGKAYSTVGE